MSTDAHLSRGMASSPKTSVGDPCQFYSDRRHHVFMHEKAPQTKICGVSSLDHQTKK